MSAQFRRYPATNCYSPGEHDEGDYVVSDGAFYNQGTRGRRLWCPLVDDEVCSHAQWQEARMFGWDDDTSYEISSAYCVHDPFGSGVECSFPFLGANSSGSHTTSNASYTGVYDFSWDATELDKVLDPTFDTWLPILIVDLAKTTNISFSGYEVSCSADPT